MTLALTDPRLTDTGLQADGVLEMWYASIDDMEQSLASDQAQKARLPAERGISAMGLDRTGNPVRLLKRLVAALATLALLQFVLEIVPPAEAQACGCAPENYCPYPTGEAQRMRQTLKDLARARGVPERLMPVFDGIEGCERCFEAAQVVQVSWTVDARKYREK